MMTFAIRIFSNFDRPLCGKALLTDFFSSLDLTEFGILIGTDQNRNQMFQSPSSRKYGACPSVRHPPFRASESEVITNICKFDFNVDKLFSEIKNKQNCVGWSNSQLDELRREKVLISLTRL
jgi:hypothetical protein